MSLHRPSPTGTRLWWSVASLGEVADAGALVAGWFATLRTVPGDHLVLEEGAELGGAPFLRVLARPEVIGVREGGATGTPVRLAPLSDAVEDLPPGPAETHVAYGRLIWPAGTERSSPWGRSGRVEGPLEGPFAPRPNPPLPGTMVQALVRSGGPQGPPLACHVRVAGFGAPAQAVHARDATGHRWASALQARYEPWRVGSLAHAVAHLEWRARTVRRFHSGSGAPASDALLASPWHVPWGVQVVPGGLGVADGTLGEGVVAGSEWESGRPLVLPTPSLLRHVAVVGLTGSGKTQWLVHLATEALARRIPLVVFDLHGDLGPELLSRLSPGDLARVEVMDATRSPEMGIVGVDVLGGSDHPGSIPDLELDRRASEVLAALRPIGGGKEEFWGPRMERFLEGAVRASLEGGGTLLQVAELLQDPFRRADAMAKAARTPAVREFLQELPLLVRRQPDLLASSLNRLSKVLLSRTVQALVAPPTREFDLDALLNGPRSLVVHVPKGALGESAALFVANLLLARIFLSLLRGRPAPRSWRPRRLLVLDEAQGFAPRLLRSLVEEGRKFGCACVFATQSPSRLEEVFARSPSEAVGTLVALRLPPADALRIAPLLLPAHANPGRPPQGIVASLATLPSLTAWVRPEGSAAGVLVRFPSGANGDAEAWERASNDSAWRLARTMREAGGLDADAQARTVEELLLRVVHAEARDGPLDLSPRPGSPSLERTDPSVTPRSLAWALEKARYLRWIEEPRGADGGLRARMTPDGWAQLGYKEVSGAASESDEHRRLVFEAFRLFARQGHVMRMPLQGDLREKTPDGRVSLELSAEEARHRSPLEQKELLERRSRTWAWRLGHGKTIHVEAEVTGADRPEKLRNSLEKVPSEKAFVLFVVGTPLRGRKVRRFLREAGVGADRATVWVLREDVRGLGHPYRRATVPPEAGRSRA